MSIFSYNQYIEIIQLIKKSNRQKSFKDAMVSDDFIIMRHDVEFSVDRAYEMAKLEKEYAFKSVFYFQLTNNAYNLLSKKNLDILRDMYDMGHEIGLHFHLNQRVDMEEIKEALRKELTIMKEMVGIPIDSFSFHRPTNEVLKADLRIEGYLNAYQKEFFEYVEDINVKTPKIKYLSDARHRWNYGLIPNKDLFDKYKKIQILTHPYSWTKEGYDNYNNFETLIQERSEEFIATLDSECKHFSEVKERIKGELNEK